MNEVKKNWLSPLPENLRVILRRVPALAKGIGFVAVGLILVLGPLGAAAISAQWCYSEYLFSRDKVEGKGTVVDLEKLKLRASPRRRHFYVTSYKMTVASEHGQLEIYNPDPVSVGSTVHFDYSPSQQTARFHGESALWWAMLFVFLCLGGGIVSLITVLHATKEMIKTSRPRHPRFSEEGGRQE